MKTVSAKEARIHLGQLMDDSQLSPVTISKNGKPYAVLVSAKQLKAIGGAEAIQDQVLREQIDAKLASSEAKGGEIPHDELMSELKSQYAN